MNNPIIDFPKIKSPFIRIHNEKLHYVVTPEIEPGYEWVFQDKGVCAVDKLHGTNICVTITDGHIDSIDNRTQRVYGNGLLPCKGNATKFIVGVLSAAQRWPMKDGRHYGELIGRDINGNLHGSEGYLFVPFNYLRSKCHWHSWVQNKYPKDFTSISNWFRELPSMLSKRIFDKDVLAEGLVFYHPDGRMAKLRRDMFDWYFDDPNAKAHKDE